MRAKPQAAEKRRRPSGFTLLEVLLALVLILGMIGGLLSFYRYAVEVRQTVQDETRQAATHRIVMDQLTSELRGTTFSPGLGHSLTGSKDHIQFLTTVLPKPGVWAAKDTDKVQPHPTQDLRLMTYDIRTVMDEENKPVIIGLECIWKTTLLPRYTAENHDDPGVLVTPEYKFIGFRYYDGANWTDTWSGGQLPVAVEVTIGHEPLPDGTEPVDYPFASFRREIYIPGTGAAPPALRLVRAVDAATTQPADGGDGAGNADGGATTQPGQPGHPGGEQ